MSAISLDQFKGYLSSIGWEALSVPDDYVEVWSVGGSRQSQLLLPTEAAVDKQFLLREALSKYASFTDLEVGEIVRLVREQTENAVSVRVSHPDVSDGSIPLEDGISLNSYAKELLTAAANAALERRPLYQGRQPALVSSLIQNARLGQTTHGSYVIHVFCKNLTPTELGDDFAVTTTQTLYSALTGLRQAVDAYEESGSVLPFESALTHGASANLCDALGKFSGKDKARTVQISLQTRAVDRLMPALQSTIEFLPSHQPSLRVAADYYRQTYTLVDETVVGVIERLERRAEQDSGVVRIAATLSNGAQRSVGLQLPAEDYQEAIHAHENKMMVRVTGNVIVTPRTANILEPRGFGVVGNLSLF